MNRRALVARATVVAWLAVLSAVPPVRAERELTTDRPDATESPFTVEPGRVQLEASLASYTRDRHNPEHEDVRLTIWNLAPFNVRIGLTPDSELQIIADNYLEVELEQRASGQRHRQSGWGDVTLRFKRNLWGNDGGGTAFALMPYVKLPTNTDDLGNDSVEGGIIAPFALELSGGWGFAAMTEVALVRNDADDDHDITWLNTATVSRDLGERWGTFWEVAVEAGAGKPAATFNTGVTYAVSADVQLDAGLFLGLTRAAPDLTAFAGFTSRF